MSQGQSRVLRYTTYIFFINNVLIWPYDWKHLKKKKGIDQLVTLTQSYVKAVELLVAFPSFFP